MVNINIEYYIAVLCSLFEVSSLMCLCWHCCCGDVDQEGYGTDAYIHLKAAGETCEVLPAYDPSVCRPVHSSS